MGDLDFFIQSYQGASEDHDLPHANYKDSAVLGPDSTGRTFA